MAHVTVTIHGRQFRLACEDGQEGHLGRLAAELDKSIETLRKRFGEIGDTRLTIMAALMFADELIEASGKLKAFEAELAALQEARVAAAEHSKAMQAAVSAAFNAAAERIEAITRRLNDTLGEGTVPMG